MSLKIWLADLTYTQQTISSDIMPAAIGGIGAYAQKCLPQGTEVRLFKFPQDLIAAFTKDTPHIIGFSDYVWNANLAFNFAKAIKKKFPSVVTVFGGPNFPTLPNEEEELLRAHPEVDFFVRAEGEVAFVNLASELLKNDLNPKAFTAGIPNVVFVDQGGRFVLSNTEERILDLKELPSPYLSGLLDEFFDGRFAPIIQTNRGCPFTCTFCTEGMGYWTKVRFKARELVHAELEYIVGKINALRPERRRTDMCIADSNFGMYPDDLETCRHIGKIQEGHGYPKYINVTTGKNNKERVLEAAKLVNGAMQFSGSVQSLDTGVLSNIKRSNISVQQLMDAALRFAQQGAITYSEVILALPGDSKEAHFKTLESLINANFDTLYMYQLQMLPGTELAFESTRKQFGMVTRYRIVPRCFGYFDFLGEQVVSAEIEEICVQNNTLSYEDYLACRRMNLMVNVFCNDGIFAEILKLLRLAGISPWQWIMEIYQGDYGVAFDELSSRFVEETRDELWERREDLAEFIHDTANIDKYISGELGSNLIYKYKALSLTAYFDTVKEVASESIGEVLRRCGKYEQWNALAQEIIGFTYLRAKGLFSEDAGKTQAGQFYYDIPRFFEPSARHETAAAYALPGPLTFTFRHSEDQLKSISAYIQLFGADIIGLTRTVTRVLPKKLFRHVQLPPGYPPNAARDRVAV